ncbi:NAD(P)H-dependent oxidoreductase [Nonomuraea sp. KC401]|uniref:NADPH-dependent FMN reductase n=1 Tax=unclassified Nonomuraea TaxID=2593643 RepID=UPI0010FEB486|nr:MULTISPECIES: NAD(P)H-dependent oxidoreductase [unclassified Nonomuraea]NBE94349.1 NADPH-dependent oxidoreductase [Nonomuraea sp. K271]TLF73118.1 NAD(P)H-dependent oxidoreductase [Nonomuraea sp. KC401]
MANTPLRVAVIIGSTRAGRACDAVAGWFTERARRREELAVKVLDLAGYAFPAHYPAQATPAMRRFAGDIGAADGFVVITPEYNRSFPAPLKQAIDFAYDEWQAKPVGFVSYGSGSAGHYAVEQLRTVFSALHAVTMRDWVGLDLLGGDFDGCAPLDTDDRLRAVATMLDQLTWWGRTLRAGRRAQPYVT